MHTQAANPILSPTSLWADRLHGGIWPRGIDLWMAAIWIGLFIIRPWEMLWPGLADWHIARLYAIVMIVV